MISEKHANFIINDQNGTAQDVLDLLTLAHERVEQKFGISLIPEIEVIGDWEKAARFSVHPINRPNIQGSEIMADKIKLGVILGGRSGEHEVSLMSSRSVLSVLDPEKYDVIQIGIDHEGSWWSGEDVIGKFEYGTTEGLYRVFLLPEPGMTTFTGWAKEMA